LTLVEISAIDRLEGKRALLHRSAWLKKHTWCWSESCEDQRFRLWMGEFWAAFHAL